MTYDSSDQSEERLWSTIDGAAKSMGRIPDEPTEEEEDRMDMASDCYVNRRGKWVSR